MREMCTLGDDICWIGGTYSSSGSDERLEADGCGVPYLVFQATLTVNSPRQAKQFNRRREYVFIYVSDCEIQFLPSNLPHITISRSTSVHLFTSLRIRISLSNRASMHSTPLKLAYWLVKYHTIVAEKNHCEITLNFECISKLWTGFAMNRNKNLK